MSPTSFCIPKLLVSAAALTLAGAAHCVENGAPITPFGVFDFGAGMLPPPSDVATVGVRAAFYSASELRDTNGKVSPVGIKLKVNSAALAIVKTTDIPLLGGTYGFSAVVPYLDMSNRLTIPTPGDPMPLKGTNAAVGDVTIAPVMVKWTPSPGLFVNGRLELQLPTGSYKAERLINTGSNHWTASPAVAFTWIGPSGLELSSNIQINFHGKNKDTQYQSGVEYQHEFAIGQHVGPWTLGVGGYLYQQLSDDKVNGAKFQDGNRSRVMALGPAISFFDLGSDWPLIWAHAYKEFGARNRSQGTQVAVRAAWTF
ncbi:signal peptide protein [Hydrogenophaga taeniospiralis CCUG 15921]|uniref:Signal peptide protein n=1 Tax=Hydrogenophaga taeniospiralis CCUG 15921 TaxID=1281780 RepID=A0A9X4NQX4_9BURK|nr:transporter [Hydrogenophaga taeniospiralis]MDG5976090.1 signal peptide protein [Hydrogenophaga taeniospiralis CCUG 15921]